jgi:hypothetical protein
MISSVIGISACLGDLVMTYLLGTWYPGYIRLNRKPGTLTYFQPLPFPVGEEEIALGKNH